MEIYFHVPELIDQVHIVFAPSVCLSTENFNFGQNLTKVRDRAFIFHMCITCGYTFSLVLMSRSSVMVGVNYQGRIFKKWPLREHQCFRNTTQLAHYIYSLTLSLTSPSIYVSAVQVF